MTPETWNLTPDMWHVVGGVCRVIVEQPRLQRVFWLYTITSYSIKQILDKIIISSHYLHIAFNKWPPLVILVSTLLVMSFCKKLDQFWGGKVPTERTFFGQSYSKNKNCSESTQNKYFSKPNLKKKWKIRCLDFFKFKHPSFYSTQTCRKSGIEAYYANAEVEKV